MSMTFVSGRNRGKQSADPTAIQKMLDENNQLIQTIVDYQAKGRSNDATHIQQLLHRNLVYLATLADSNHSSMQQLLQNPSQPGSAPMGAPSSGPQGPPPPGPGAHPGSNVSQGSSTPAPVHTNPNMSNQPNGMTPASMVGPTPTSDTNTSSQQSGPTNQQASNPAASFKGLPQQGDNPNMPASQTVSSSASSSTPSSNMPNYTDTSSSMAPPLPQQQPPPSMSGGYYGHQNPQMQQGSMMAPQSSAQPMQQPNMPSQAPSSHFPQYPQQQISQQQPQQQSQQQQQQQQQQPPLTSSMQGGTSPMLQSNTPNQQPSMPSGYRPQTIQGTNHRNRTINGQSPYNQQPQPSPQGSYNPQYAANQQSYMPNQQMPRHGYPGNMPAPNATQYPQQGPGSYAASPQQARNYNYVQGPQQQPQGQPSGQPFAGYNQSAQYRGGYQQ